MNSRENCIPVMCMSLCMHVQRRFAMADLSLPSFFVASPKHNFVAMFFTFRYSLAGPTLKALKFWTVSAVNSRVKYTTACTGH